MGAIARIGTVWETTMYGRKPRRSTVECASTTREQEADRPRRARKPASASFAVKSA